MFNGPAGLSGKVLCLQWHGDFVPSAEPAIESAVSKAKDDNHLEKLLAHRSRCSRLWTQSIQVLRVSGKLTNVNSLAQQMLLLWTYLCWWQEQECLRFWVETPRHSSRYASLFLKWLENPSPSIHPSTMPCVRCSKFICGEWISWDWNNVRCRWYFYCQRCQWQMVTFHHRWLDTEQLETEQLETEQTETDQLKKLWHILDIHCWKGRQCMWDFCYGMDSEAACHLFLPYAHCFHCNRETTGHMFCLNVLCWHMFFFKRWSCAESNWHLHSWFPCNFSLFSDRKPVEVTECLAARRYLPKKISSCRRE